MNFVSRVCLVVLGMMVLCGCKRTRIKEAPKTTSPANKAASSAPGLPRAEAVKRLLQRIPADNETVVLLDAPGLYRMLGELEAALRQTPMGKDLVRQARFGSAAAPVPVPWEQKDLARLGLDGGGVAAAYGEDEPDIFVLPVAHRRRFKKQLAAVLQTEAAWTSAKQRGRVIHSLSGRGQAHCHFSPGRATCSPSQKRLREALEQTPRRSLWEALSPDLRRAAQVSSALLVSLTSGSNRLVGALQVMADGVALDLRISDRQLQGALASLGGSDQGSLLGLARGARSVFCMRLRPAAVLASMPALGLWLEQAGLQPARVASALTGELLVLEQGERSPLLVIGSRDQAMARKLVGTLGRALMAQANKRRGSAGLRLEVKQLPPGAGQAGTQGSAFGIKVKSGAKRSPLDQLDLRLAAGKPGIMLGHSDDVKALARKKPAPPVSTFREALTSEVDRTAFGPRLVLASSSLLREPFASIPAPAEVEQMIGSGQFPHYIKRGFFVLRFLYDQLHHQTVGLQRTEEGGLRLVLRLTTLHRGEPGDEAARRLYIGGLKARYRGDPKAYERVLQLLQQQHSATRYGKLRERKVGGLSGPVMILGATAAVAIPGYIKYTRKLKTAEALASLERIQVGARAYFLARHPGTDGKPQPPQFPSTIPLTPAGGAPCGKIRTTPADWKRRGWHRLGFILEQPHAFAYSFSSQGTGQAATYTARAHGDLDCDGVLSTFEIRGSVDRRMQVKVSPLKVTNELE